MEANKQTHTHTHAHTHMGRLPPQAGARLSDGISIPVRPGGGGAAVGSLQEVLLTGRDTSIHRGQADK